MDNGKADASTVPAPLQGVTVIELSHLIAGPYSPQLLASEGALVIKVERPGGELSRHREPMRHGNGGSVSAHYASYNQGKQSIVLDLKNDEGLSTLHGLIASANVFVTNFRHAALKRLGLDPKTLLERYPALVIACVSGYGFERSGEYADRAGLAMVAEATSGVTALTRDHAGNPVWCGYPLGDVLAGMTAHSAILLALRNQDRFGVGRIIDLGLVDCALPLAAIALARIQLADEELSAFAAANDYHGVPYGVYPASDGFVNIGVNSDVFWRRLCAAMERTDLGTDPRYATYIERAKRQSEVNAITSAFSSSLTRAELTAKLTEVDVPAASVLTTHEVLNNEYVKQRGLLHQVDDGIGGTLTLPVNPAYPDPTYMPRIPRLDQHRSEVLASRLGLTAADIERLERAGAFGPLVDVGSGANTSNTAPT